MRNKITSAAEAVAIVQSGDAICTSGFVGIGVPDALLVALEKRFLDTGEPRDLTLLFAAGQGDGKDRGLNALGHEGLLRRAIGGHWGLIPKVGRLAMEGHIEAYNLPQGVISHMYRDIAAGKPGTISRVGLGTFVDPRLEGGKINGRTTEDIVRLIEIDGQEWLFYRGLPLQIAFLRGTTSDPNGNVTAEREALDLDNLAMAMAVKNSGGVVIVQVERIARSGFAESAAGAHSRRSCRLRRGRRSPNITGRPMRPPTIRHTAPRLLSPWMRVSAMPLDERKVIARRCALELRAGAIVNLGIGMPEGVGAVAAEELISDLFTMTAEPGVIGGVPASGLDFGAAVNTDAIIHQNQQFDFYDGGGLDIAVLGMAEVDREGNVNVSRFGTKLAGAGGFINISQNARKVIFAGTFTASGLDLRIEDSKLRIVQEGRARKFGSSVQQVTFSGTLAAKTDKAVLYVTERCVFRLTDGGLELVEVAPGIDIDRDILAHMAFRPLMGQVREMDARLFRTETLGLRSRLIDLDLTDRLAFDVDRNILFLNFEGLHVRSSKDVDAIREAVTLKVKEIGRRVAVVVNYDSFRLDDDVASEYAEMVRDMENAHYTRVSRYTTSAFMRVKLGRELTRTVRPHIFESKAEAQAFHSKA